MAWEQIIHHGPLIRTANTRDKLSDTPDGQLRHSKRSLMKFWHLNYPISATQIENPQIIAMAS